MISIISDKRDVTKTRLWEAYREMVEHYEDGLARLSDAVTGSERARCPHCSMPTVPNHSALSFEDRTCERCAEVG